MHLVVCFFCFFLVPVQVLVTLDCVCLDLGHILNWCFKEANIELSLAMPPHRLPDLNSQQHDTLLCLSVVFVLSLSLTIEMRLLTRLCKITMINKICTYFLSCNIPTILLIQSVRCACVYPPTQCMPFPPYFLCSANASIYNICWDDINLTSSWRNSYIISIASSNRISPSPPSH